MNVGVELVGPRGERPQGIRFLRRSTVFAFSGSVVHITRRWCWAEEKLHRLRKENESEKNFQLIFWKDSSQNGKRRQAMIYIRDVMKQKSKNIKYLGADDKEEAFKIAQKRNDLKYIESDLSRRKDAEKHLHNRHFLRRKIQLTCWTLWFCKQKHLLFQIPTAVIQYNVGTTVSSGSRGMDGTSGLSRSYSINAKLY